MGARDASFCTRTCAASAGGGTATIGLRQWHLDCFDCLDGKAECGRGVGALGIEVPGQVPGVKVRWKITSDRRLETPSRVVFAVLHFP